MTFVIDRIRSLIESLDLTRHPWASRSVLMSAVASTAGALVALGIAQDVVETWQSAAGTVIAIAAVLGIVRNGETKTTPVADPRDEEGRPLGLGDHAVPADLVEAHEASEWLAAVEPEDGEGG